LGRSLSHVYSQHYNGLVCSAPTASLDVIEMVVSLLLIIVFLAVGAFWPYLVARFADRHALRRSCTPSGTGDVAP